MACLIAKADEERQNREGRGGLTDCNLRLLTTAEDDDSVAAGVIQPRILGQDHRVGHGPQRAQESQQVILTRWIRNLDTA